MNGDIKYCEVCDKKIDRKDFGLGRKWWAKRKFCSRKCTTIAFAGKKLSKEHIEKLRQSHLGFPGFWKGKKRPELKKTGAIKTMFKKGENRRLGFKWSLEQRKMLSEAHLKGEINRRTLNKKIRQLQEYHDWRKTIFERDNYTCQFCEKRGFRLCADHIKMMSKILRENGIKSEWDAIKCEELWNIGNGRTLCDDCHLETPTYGSRKYE